MSYNANIPQATDIISQSQGQILTNFGQLNTQFSVDHIALTAGSANGQHKQVTLNTYGTTPYTNTGTQSYIYSKGVNNSSSLRSQLEYQASQATANILPATPKAMVRFNAAGTIQSGYRFNVASVSVGSSVNFTVTFSEALADTNYFVMAAIERNTNVTNITGNVSTKATGSFVFTVNDATDLTSVNIMVF